MNDLSSPLPVAEAVRAALAAVSALPVEDVAVPDALGRALAEPLRAAQTLPPFDTSTVDGYAVRARDASAAALIVLDGEARPASDRGAPLPLGTCARVLTGAPLPPGADAVVMQEEVELVSGGRVKVLTSRVFEGQNVRPAGEDGVQGDVLMESGTSVGLPELGWMLAQRLSRVRVRKRPRVAIAASGDELLGGARIDTNSPLLARLVERAGGLPTLLGVAADDLEASCALLEAGRGSDMIITTGGVSVGPHDCIRAALSRMGARELFWRVAMRPGKPILVATLGHALVFALPGNPASCLVGFELFVRPCLRRMQGHMPVVDERVPGVLGASVAKPANLSVYLRARVERRGAALVALPLQSQSSGALRSIAGATHLVELPAGVTRFEEGASVELLPVAWGA